MALRLHTAYQQQTLALNGDRFFENLPKKPYCSDDLAGGIHPRIRNTAVKHAYIQHNPPSMRYWITFDLDHEHFLIWEDAGLPDPNFVVRNRHNRRCHIHYAIEAVCTSEAGRIKPVQYAAAIQDTYAELLKADIGYTGFITKNPYSPDWSVRELHQHEFSLGELADYVDLKTRYWTRKRAANDKHYGLGRNCALFHRLRFWAYDHVTYYRDTGSPRDQWMKLTLEKAESMNTFDSPLPYSEIKSTAKSVGKWVWERYFPQGKTIRRGAMAETFDASQLPLDLATRQRLSARRTNKARRESSEEKIITAINQLKTEDRKVTKAAVSRLVGISRQSLLKDYEHIFLAQK